MTEETTDNDTDHDIDSCYHCMKADCLDKALRLYAGTAVNPSVVMNAADRFMAYILDDDYVVDEDSNDRKDN